MRRFVPVITLFLLSPLIAEVIFGATPSNNLQSLLIVAPVYGGGALLIREVVRRRGGGWGHIALLGAAYGIVEEGIALQSLFDYDMFNAGAYGLHAFGVNWVWSEWTIGYHILWSITIPIVLAELLFPDKRAAPWLGRVGLVVVGALYALGVAALATITRLFVALNFRTPLQLLIGAGIVIIALVALALNLPVASAESLPEIVPTRDAPSPWIIGVVTFLASGFWFLLLFSQEGWRNGALLFGMMGLVLVVAFGAVWLLRPWSAPDRRWTDLHRYGAIMGPMLVQMIVGYRVTAGNATNQLFQMSVSAITLILLVVFGFYLYRREQSHLVHVHQG